MQLIAKTNEARRLSADLRTAKHPFLRRRRAVVALSAVSLASMTLISLYQMGLIDHLPEPPLPGMDADKVDASPEAYAILSTPDATLGAVSYGVTMVLAAMQGPRRAEEAPWIPLALAAKATGDAIMAAKLSVDQWTKHKAFCLWCLLAAAATIASVPLVLPEARAAWQTLEGPRQAAD